MVQETILGVVSAVSHGMLMAFLIFMMALMFAVQINPPGDDDDE